MSMLLENPAPQHADSVIPSTRRVRVLHLINGEHYAGAERVQDLLARHLPELGVDIGFVCLKPGRFAEARESVETPLWQLPMRNRFDLLVARRLAQIAKAEKFDLLHAHTPRSALLGRFSASLSGIPLVFHVHSPVGRDTTFAWRNWINTATERLSLSGVRAMICVSRSLQQYMCQRGYDPARISVVPNGVPSHGPLDSRPRPTGTWTLGTVALVRPRKGIEVLIDALAGLRAQNAPVRLRVVGPFESQEYERELRARAERLNVGSAVDWIGFTKQVPAELRKIDLFVLPSLFGEGMPMVVLEAMTAGAPVIASDVEGIHEVIRNGIDGLIVRPNDPDQIAQAVQRFLNGEISYHDCRTSAWHRHRDLFSATAMSRGVAEVYRTVLCG
jgi:glycosyltransferase involved in cell wall biosynthesis